jgi:hypothetical protein
LTIDNAVIEEPTEQKRAYHSGPGYEKFVLGISSSEARNLVNGHYPKHGKFEKLVSITKSIQQIFNGWNPKEPSTETGKDLYQRIKTHLKDECGELRLYVSLGTPLDYYFGTDCFFELKDDCGHSSIVTIDLTINRSKRRSNADFILRGNDSENGRNKRVMKDVAEALTRGLSRPGRKRKRHPKGRLSIEEIREIYNV